MCNLSHGDLATLIILLLPCTKLLGSGGGGGSAGLRTQSAVIRGVTRAIVTQVASYRAMTDTVDRLRAALADRYAIERELSARLRPSWTVSL